MCSVLTTSERLLDGKIKRHLSKLYCVIGNIYQTPLVERSGIEYYLLLLLFLMHSGEFRTIGTYGFDSIRAGNSC